jgi:hypothetical protein
MISSWQKITQQKNYTALALLASGWLLWSLGVLLLGFALLQNQVQAETAHWYQWESKISGNTICRQQDPGTGWQKVAGPYLDGGCRLELDLPLTRIFPAARA